MVSYSGLGIGLSFLFGFILMGLVAALYYSLWRQKRSVTVIRGEISRLFCWKKKHNSVNNSQEQTNSLKNPEECGDVHEQMGSSKDSLVNGYGEQGVETELMRMHNLCGPQPPRFLFTIKEETGEDLESDDGKSKGDNSSGKESRTTLSDLFAVVDGTDTPYSSPSIRTFGSCYDHGLRALSEEAELNRLRCYSSPKLKFLKDGEDKLLMEETENKSGLFNGGLKSQNSRILTEEEKNGSFMSFIDKSCYKESQVLPLESSPTFRLEDFSM